MGRICSIFGRDTSKIKGTYAYSLEELGVDGRIILNRIINSSGSRQKPLAVCRQHRNKCLDSTRGQFLNQLSDCQLLSKKYAVWYFSFTTDFLNLFCRKSHKPIAYLVLGQAVVRNIHYPGFFSHLRELALSRLMFEATFGVLHLLQVALHPYQVLVCYHLLEIQNHTKCVLQNIIQTVPVYEISQTEESYITEQSLVMHTNFQTAQA